jgi:hypothetical protein
MYMCICICIQNIIEVYIAQWQHTGLKVSGYLVQFLFTDCIFYENVNLGVIQCRN